MPYEKIDNVHMMITVEMDLNVTALLRTRYTALDLMAQFGGFIGIWGKVFAFLMSAWNYQAVQNFMVTRLYKVRPVSVSENITIDQ